MKAKDWNTQPLTRQALAELLAPWSDEEAGRSEETDSHLDTDQNTEPPTEAGFFGASEQSADEWLATCMQIVLHPLSNHQWAETVRTGDLDSYCEADEIDEELWDELEETQWESWLRRMQQQWEEWRQRSPQESRRQASQIWQMPLASVPGSWVPRGGMPTYQGRPFPLFAMFVPLQSSTREPSDEWIPQWEQGEWNSEIPIDEPLVFRSILREPGYLTLLQLHEDNEQQVTLLFPLTDKEVPRRPGTHELFYYRFVEPGQARFLLLHSSVPTNQWLGMTPESDEQGRPVPMAIPFRVWEQAFQRSRLQAFPFAIHCRK